MEPNQHGTHLVTSITETVPLDYKIQFQLVMRLINHKQFTKNKGNKILFKVSRLGVQLQLKFCQNSNESQALWLGDSQKKQRRPGVLSIQCSVALAFSVVMI